MIHSNVSAVRLLYCVIEKGGNMLKRETNKLRQCEKLGETEEKRKTFN